MLFDYVVKSDRPSLIKSSKERSPAAREKAVKCDRLLQDVTKSDRPWRVKKSQMDLDLSMLKVRSLEIPSLSSVIVPLDWLK